MVKEINTTTADARPYGIRVIDGIGYFSAESNNGSRYPWRTDGTPAGTYQLVSASDQPVFSSGSFTSLNNFIFFTGSENDLWRSDGTAQGTSKFSDLLPGTWDNVFNLTAVGESLYFTTGGNGFDPALWRSDGTPAGTEIVYTLPITDERYPQFEMVHDFQGQLIFAARDGVTVTLYSIAEASGAVQTLAQFEQLGDQRPVLLEGQIYFAAIEQDRWEIWRTDGTPNGTESVALAFFGFEGREPQNLIVHDGALYFTSLVAFSWQLYRLQNDEISAVPDSSFGYIFQLISFADDLYMAISDDGRHSLLRSDQSGPVNVTIDQNIQLTFFGGETILKTDDYIYFQGTVVEDPTEFGDMELWRFDGITSERTADIDPDGSSKPHYLTAFGDGVLFSAETAAQGTELYHFDGANASLLKDINTRSNGSNPRRFVQHDGGVAFVANSGDEQRAVWWTDGSADNTRRITPFFSNWELDDLTSFAGHLYFTHYRELWRTDGTEAGTTLMQEYISSPSFLTVAGDKLFFSAAQENNTRYLHLTDGATFTSLTTGGGVSTNLTAGGDILYFTTPEETATGPATLWRSDGTDAGTYSLNQYDGPAQIGTNIFSLTYHDGKVYFAAQNALGHEPWISDGTAEGTHLLKDIEPVGDRSSNPDEFTVYNDKIVFTAFSSDLGRQLWISNGTEAGTQLFLDRPEDETSFGPRLLTSFAGSVYFVLRDDALNETLWRSDEADRKAYLVGQLPSDTGTSAGFVQVGGWLYFAGRDQVFGDELWRTNGSEIVRVTDLNPSGDAGPRWLTALGDQLLFQAQNEGLQSLGNVELYRFRSDPLPNQKMYLPLVAFR